MKPKCCIGNVSNTTTWTFSSIMKSIPIEVIQHNIFPYMEHADLKYCRLVCKLWDEFCRNTSTFILLNVQLKFDEELFHLNRKGFGFHDWTINKLKIVNNNIDYEYIYQILREIKRKSDLEHLILDKRIDFNQPMSQLVLNFPNLKHFSMNSTNLTNHAGLIRIVSNLESLKLRVMNLEKDFLLNLTNNFGSNLVKLKIGASFIGNEHLSCLTSCKQARNLKCLEIVSRRHEKFNIEANFSNFKEVEELSLEFGDANGEACLNEIVKIENLRVLSLSRMNLGDISKHFEKLKRLESLSLHNCNFKGLNQVYKLQRLKCLSIKGGTLDEQDVVGISQLELTKLALDRCGISADLICKHSRMNSLRELSLTGIPLTEEAISIIGREFTQLRTLSISSISMEKEKLQRLLRNDLFSSLRNLSLISCNLNDDHLETILDTTSILSRLSNLNIDLNDFSENSLKSLQNQNAASMTTISTRSRKSSFSNSDRPTSPKRREKQGCLFQ
ncbi:Hypothetical protein NAEGRDRAFT_71536 [Naegleria gruberi]|uniref:Disease resistance R13L4/SHOC-2-like LRR domain-containing protein n=1 Tax=Naegleria gruberi TaxID=5762 RepID=D2VRC4_NAEGR|nr:uncharacterized protein NAEGRDRAFT_71536 [Naegleria gruberi]EFC40583.1 Hypothetical protein NAEGRDRAFT_71536 [Naegleria gruberi]|eukprot:XP_002673327.1 Hypothetical protein NAEGRDRAFT_71536 [Naegleria gruberi strain NEG-M]